ncbi:hypothetical protein ACJX0J_036776, partial [Zea mays]
LAGSGPDRLPKTEALDIPLQCYMLILCTTIVGLNYLFLYINKGYVEVAGGGKNLFKNKLILSRISSASEYSLLLLLDIPNPHPKVRPSADSAAVTLHDWYSLQSILMHKYLYPKLLQQPTTSREDEQDSLKYHAPRMKGFEKVWFQTRNRFRVSLHHFLSSKLFSFLQNNKKKNALLLCHFFIFFFYWQEDKETTSFSHLQRMQKDYPFTNIYRLLKVVCAMRGEVVVGIEGAKIPYYSKLSIILG